MLKTYTLSYFYIIGFVFLPILSQTKQIRLLQNLNENGTVNSFIPKGYLILDMVSGELNGDNYKDVLLVLKKEGEDTMYNPAPKRLLYILTGGPGDEYKLSAKNENAIYNHDEGGVSKSEPYDGIKIEKDIFIIEHSGGMGAFHWMSKIYFQYSSKEHRWCLYKNKTHEVTLDYHYGDTIKSDEYHITVASDSTHIETELDFGKIYFENFDIHKH
jgi:hypothetical protein